MVDEFSKFERQIQTAITWVRTHQERFWSVTGTAVIVIVLFIFALHRHQEENAQAWTQLGVVQGQLIQGKYDDAKKSVDQWEQRFKSSSASGYERFLKADLLYKTSDYAQAAQVYGSLSESAPNQEMKPLALSAQESAEEMAGHLPQALAAAEALIDKYPDHFLTARAYMAKARIAEMQGNIPMAISTYDRFLMLYPQHPSAAIAKARRQAIGGSAAPVANTAPIH